MDKKSLKCSELNENLKSYNSMATVHTVSADKDHVVRSKAPKLLNGPCDKTFFSCCFQGQG